MRDEPYPKRVPWPLDPALEWLTFQNTWSEVIKPPANLIAVYQHLLAIEIDRFLRSKDDVRN